MGYWERLGFIRKDKMKCFEYAELEVRSKETIKLFKFRFKTIAEDRVDNVESSLAITYDKRIKGIFVFDYKLPFVSGARVKFNDNTTMTVTNVVKVIDEDKAESDGKGIIGLNVYFGG